MTGASEKEIGVIISRSTCQLLNNKTGTKEFPVSNGCSILMEYNSNYYCLSNAHVLGDNNYGKTYFLEGNGITSNMGGRIFISQPGGGKSRKEDIFDLGVVQLDPQTVEALKRSGKTFITMADIKTGHSISSSDLLYFVGYPASKTKVKIASIKTVQRIPFFFLTYPVILKRPNQQIHHPEFHVIAKYSRGRTVNINTNTVSTGPSPVGMSGSGIWLLTKKNFEFKVELIGIFSEYHENRSLLIGSKIDLFIDLIKKKVDPTIPNNGIRIEILE